MPERSKKSARRPARGERSRTAREPGPSRASSAPAPEPSLVAASGDPAMSCARPTGTAVDREARSSSDPRVAQEPASPPDPSDGPEPLEAATSFFDSDWTRGFGAAQTLPTGNPRRRRALTDREAAPWQERFDRWAELGDRVGRRCFADEASNEEADRRSIEAGAIPLSALRTLLHARPSRTEIEAEHSARAVVICATPLCSAAFKYDAAAQDVDFILAPSVPRFRHRSYLNRTRPSSALGSKQRASDTELVVCSLADSSSMTVRQRRSFLARAARRLVPGGRFALFVPYGNSARSIPTPSGCGADSLQPLSRCLGGEILFFRRLGAQEGRGFGHSRPPHGVADFPSTVFEVLVGWLSERRSQRLEALVRDLRRRDALSPRLAKDLGHLRRRAHSTDARALIARCAKQLVPTVAADYRRFVAGDYEPAPPRIIYLLKARYRADERRENHRLDEAAWSSLAEDRRARYRSITVHQALDRLLLGVVAADLGHRLAHHLSGMCVGGRRGWSPLRTISGVRQELEELGRTGRVYWTVVDVANFFDRIPHRKLYPLVRAHLPAETVTGLTALFGPECESGLPQGAPLSPILANAFLARFLDLPLLRWRWEGRRPVRFWRYLDDILVVGSSEDEVAAAMRRVRALIADEAGLEVSEKTPPCVHAAEERPVEFLGLRITAPRVTLTEVRAAAIRRLLSSEEWPASSKRGLLLHYQHVLDADYFAATFGDLAAKQLAPAPSVPEGGTATDVAADTAPLSAEPEQCVSVPTRPASVTTSLSRDDEFDSLSWAMEQVPPFAGDPSCSVFRGQPDAAADAARAPHEADMRVRRARIDSRHQDSERLSVRRLSPELDHLLDLRAGGLIVVSAPIGHAPRFVAPLAHAILHGSEDRPAPSDALSRTAFFGPPPDFKVSEDWKSRSTWESMSEDWVYGLGDNPPFAAPAGSMTQGWLFGYGSPYSRPSSAIDVARYDILDSPRVSKGVDPPLLSKAAATGLRRIEEGRYRLVIADLSVLRFSCIHLPSGDILARRSPHLEKRDALRNLLDAMDECERRGFPRPTAIVISGGGVYAPTGDHDRISDEAFYADWADAVLMLDVTRDRLAATGLAQLRRPPRMCDHWAINVYVPGKKLRRVVHASQVVYEAESRLGRTGILPEEWDAPGRMIDLLGWRDGFPESFAALPLKERRKALESQQLFKLLRKRLPTAPPTPFGLRTLRPSTPGLVEAGLNRIDGDNFAQSLADRLGGKVQPNSGAGRAKGDVRTRNAVIEAKRTSSSSYTLNFLRLQKLLDDRDAEARREPAAPPDPDRLSEQLRPVYAILFAKYGTERFVTPTDDVDRVHNAQVLTGESLPITANSPSDLCFRTPQTGSVVWEIVALEDLLDLVS